MRKQNRPTTEKEQKNSPYSCRGQTHLLSRRGENHFPERQRDKYKKVTISKLNIFSNKQTFYIHLTIIKIKNYKK